MKVGKMKTALFLGNLVFSLLVGVIIIDVGRVWAQTTKVFVDPKTSIKEPGETFVINVNISEVTNLMAYTVRIDFNSTILYSNSTMLQEGPFLKSSGETTWTPDYGPGWVEGACEFVQTIGANGSGTLFDATFQVLARGKSDLFLTVSRLMDINFVDPIPHDKEDGIFYTRGPTAMFTYRPEKETVAFNASESKDYNGYIVSYKWNFDDGTNATETDPITTHAYAAGGTYNVTLTVTDNETLTDTAWKLVSLATIYVDPPSKNIERGDIFTVDIKIANVTGLSSWEFQMTWDETILYTNETLVKEGPFLSNVGTTFFIKSFPPTVQPPAKARVGCLLMDPVTANGSGTLANMTFIVKANAKGQTAIDIFATQLLDINVLPIAHSSIDSLVQTKYPVASFIFNYEDKPRRNPLINQVITFNATASYDPNGNIVSYEWNFGDGNITIENDPIITHAYAQEGTYKISLKVTDNESLSDIVSESEDLRKEIVVVAKTGIPVADFSFIPEKPIVDERVVFNALESKDEFPGNLTKYSWNFGDGISLNATTPIETHIYRKAGTYVVNLTVYDNEGNSHLKEKSITVGLHELVITSTTINQTTAKMGQPINITVTVLNNGTFAETFNTTIYCDGNELEAFKITELAAEASTKQTFTWDTTDIQTGSYVIKALATPVENERDTASNIYIVGIVTIEKWVSTISLNLAKKTVKIDESVVINGSLIPSRANAGITISYSLNGGSWVDITAQTTPNGEYSHELRPSEAGVYVVKASWDGDERTLQAFSEIKTLTVETAEIISPTVLYGGVAIAFVVVAAIVIYLMRGRIRKG